MALMLHYYRPHIVLLHVDYVHKTTMMNLIAKMVEHSTKNNVDVTILYIKIL
jgi:hypothetical protein